MLRKTLLFLYILVLSVSLYAEPEKMILTEGGMLISANREGMIKVSYDGGDSWTGISPGLPEKCVYPFTEKEYRDISSVYYDEETSAMAACGSDFVAFCGAGSSGWKTIPVKAPVKERAYFSSVALKPAENGFLIMAGTSCDGFFCTSDMGETWEIFPSNRFYIGAGFYEELTAVCPAKGEGPYSWYAAAAPDNLVYGFDPVIQRWRPVPVPDAVSALPIHSLTDTGASLKVISGSGVYECSYDGLEWYSLDGVKLPYIKKKVKAAATAENRTGIYLSYGSGRGERLDRHIEFIKARGMNSLVIDLKDDFGNITCGTGNAMAAEVGTDKEYFSLKELLEKAHAEGIYVIGRIVVFKDEKLYNHDNYRYAVRDMDTGEPWRHIVGGTQREYWVDPFCSDVWDYNIALAQEFAAAGIDEIQFDYIRFPTDGKISRIHYPYRKEGMTNSDALESFLRKAREHIAVPISVDFYGFNGWNKIEKKNGQNLDMAARYVDVVCPMYYPSHFSEDFHRNSSYMEWSEYIYRSGTERAAEIVRDTGCIIRPYVQAFLVGKELKMEKDEYFEYFLRQIKGTEEGMGSGYTLWNASNRYYMVPEDFRADSFSE